MTGHVAFMNREQALARIDVSIQAWGTRCVLCLDGPDGIGKTWLLREVYRRYRHVPAAPLIVADILDFADHALHIPQNVGYRLATMLDTKIFEPYLFVLHNWHKMGLSGMNSPQLTQTVQALNQTFTNTYNLIASQHRMLLLFDSLDAVEQPDVLHYLSEMSRHLENTVVLLAGRTMAQLEPLLQAHHSGRVEVITLTPFSQQASALYLDHAQEQLSTRLDPLLKPKLLALARGQPILLNLAATWAAHTPPPDWLQASTPEALALEDSTAQQQTFTHLLAEHIATPHTPLGQLTLLMARIAPVHAEMVSTLLNLPAADVQTLMAEARKAVFVRQLPQQRLALHAAIEQRVQHHVWPCIDPDGQQRRQQSQRIADYLEYEIATLIEQIAHLQAHEQASVPDEQHHDPTRPLMERHIVEEDLWRLRGHLLTHRLAVDVPTGLKTFTELFATATRTYRLRFRDQLFVHIEPYTTLLTPPQRITFDACRVAHLFDQTQYLDCKQLAALLLEQETITPEQSVDLLLYMGNAEMRLGYLDQGEAHFERALRVCKLHTLRAGWVRVLNARGWAYRNQGKHDEALLDYVEAYQRSLHLEDTQQTAWILNNISFVNALRGDRQAAFEACQTALNLWVANGSLRGKAATYSTLGGIHIRFNEPAEALVAYNTAFDIFVREQDTDWMGLVRCGRAYVYQVQGDLTKATEDLQWAMAHGPVNLRTRILYSQGLVAWAQGDLTLARQKLHECRTFSQEIGDLFHDYKGFADLIELAWEVGEFGTWPQLAQEFEQLYADREGTDAIRLRGSCLRKIGDLAICHGDYDAALDFYEEGFPILAEHEIHERYTIRSQMRQTDTRIRGRIPGKILSRLGIALAQFWRSNTTLVLKYPEALLTFHRWEQEGESLEQTTNPVVSDPQP